MATTLSSINIDTKVKREAMRNAKAMGLQFSTLVNGLLRNFNEKPSVVFELPEVPNAKTAALLRKARADWKKGVNYVSFATDKEMDDYLMSL